MSGLSTWFKFGGDTGFTSSNPEIAAIFPMSIEKSAFIEIDIVTIYSKILIDVSERSHGLTEDQLILLWDNCVQSESSDGLITMLSKAMANKSELFLVYDKALNVLVKATNEQQTQIRIDYKNSGKSSVGVFISFKSNTRSDMVRLYSAFEYLAIGSLNKLMNLANAIQFKIDQLRGTVSLSDSATAQAQAVSLSEALGNGQNVAMDSKDIIETAVIQMTPIEGAISFIDRKRAFYLGMPAAYITGEQTAGMGSSGENDTKAIERGLKNYFFSVFKPVVDALFGINASYKSQDFRSISGALELLKTFETTTEDYISKENKQIIVNKFFDLPEDAEGDYVEPIQVDVQNNIPGAQDVSTAQA